MIGYALLPFSSDGICPKFCGQLAYGHQLLVPAQALVVSGHGAPKDGAFPVGKVFGMLVAAVAALPMPAALAFLVKGLAEGEGGPRAHTV